MCRGTAVAGWYVSSMTTAPGSLFALALAALVVLVGAAPAGAATPGDARAFVDSIGVNTHLFYDDTAYADFPMIEQRLAELGVRHVRDGLDPDRRQWFYDRVNRLGAAGIKSTLITCHVTGGEPKWTNLDNFVEDAKVHLRGSVEALEGANEPPITSGGTWLDGTRGCQWHLNYLAKHEHRDQPPIDVPILGPSVAYHLAETLGDIGDRADVANFHPYPGGNEPSGNKMGRNGFTNQMAEIFKWEFPGRSVPIQATETGYHDAVNCAADDPQCSHPPTSQRASAIYLPRLLLEYAKAGVQRTFLYELVDLRPDPERDDRESNFGLFENDWSYKPAAHAVKNTIGFLDSPSASPREPLGYTLTNTADPDGSGTGGPVKDMLFQQADGTWWLALWQASTVYTNAGEDISNPSVKVGVQLDRTLTATGYRPTQGTSTYGSVTASSFTAGVSDDVLLIKMHD